MSARIEQLEEFAKEEPHDPFNLYALALEYQKEDTDKALATFNRLLAEHEQYVPTYYHLGKLYQLQGNLEMAIGIFERGITMAQMANDHKASRELQAARQELLFDN
jgi:tetratricopeptide (TPR) repeat protein